MSVGERLRNLRVRAKKTLKDQSENFGVSVNSVYRWEHDLARPRTAVLKKMAEHYGVSYDWLAHGSTRDDVYRFSGEIHSHEDDIELQLLRMFRKLTTNNKYKILGYVERVCVENMDLDFSYNKPPEPDTQE